MVHIPPSSYGPLCSWAFESMGLRANGPLNLWASDYMEHPIPWQSPWTSDSMGLPSLLTSKSKGSHVYGPWPIWSMRLPVHRPSSRHVPLNKWISKSAGLQIYGTLNAMEIRVHKPPESMGLPNPWASQVHGPSEFIGIYVHGVPNAWISESISLRIHGPPSAWTFEFFRLPRPWPFMCMGPDLYGPCASQEMCLPVHGLLSRHVLLNKWISMSMRLRIYGPLKAMGIRVHGPPESMGLLSPWAHWVHGPPEFMGLPTPLASRVHGPPESMDLPS